MNTTIRQTRKSPSPQTAEEMGVAANPEENPTTHAPGVQVIATTYMPAQRHFVLKMLRKSPTSTLAFWALGVCHPGSRLKELRDGGFDIPKT